MTQPAAFCLGFMGTDPVQFCNSNEEVQAQVTTGAMTHHYAVGILPTCSGTNYQQKTTIEKIKWLVRSPFYRIELSHGIINFKAIDPLLIDWQIQDKVTINPSGVIAANGTIAYWKGEQLILKDWKTGKETSPLQETCCIQPDLQMTPGGYVSYYCGEHDAMNYVDVDSKKKVSVREKNEPDLQDQLEANGYTIAEIPGVIDRIQKFYQDNRWSSFLLDDSENRIKRAFNIHVAPSIKVLSNGLIAAPKLVNRSPTEFALLNPRLNDLQWCSKHELSGWSVKVIKELSNHLLAVGTVSRGALFALYRFQNQTCEKIYQCDFGSATVRNIIELPEGVLLIRTDNEFFPIFPKVCNIKRSDAFQIEAYKFLITHALDDMKRYDALAELYLKQGNSKAACDVYMSAIAPALRQGLFYRARRFFEKALRWQDSYDPLPIIRYYQDQLPGHPKEKIKLDLLSYYLTDDHSLLSTLPIDRKCTLRLFLGAGGFSCILAFLKKHIPTHSRLPEAITATELRLPTEEENAVIEMLKEMGVTVESQINATTIHKHFSGRRFRRIHWNLPYPVSLQDTTHPQVMVDFFKSAQHLQSPGDRIHITIRSYVELEATRNPLLRASIQAGYQLIRKRRFNAHPHGRYPGYQPVKSETGDKLVGYDDCCEYIFRQCQPALISAIKEQIEGSDLELMAKGLMDEQEKLYTVKEHKFHDGIEDKTELYYECSTDDESSDGYESESDEEAPTSLKRKFDDGLDDRKAEKRMKIEGVLDGSP